MFQKLIRDSEFMKSQSKYMPGADPGKRSKMKVAQLNIRITEDTKRKLEEIAKKEKRSMANMVEILINDRYDKEVAKTDE